MPNNVFTNGHVLMWVNMDGLINEDCLVVLEAQAKGEDVDVEAVYDGNPELLYHDIDLDDVPAERKLEHLREQVRNGAWLMIHNTNNNYLSIINLDSVPDDYVDMTEDMFSEYR